MRSRNERVLWQRKKIRRSAARVGNYEVRNKTERVQATKQYNTRLPRELHDEICAFLKKNRITKVELIVAGYQALLDHYGPKEQQNQE